MDDKCLEHHIFNKHNIQGVVFNYSEKLFFVDIMDKYPIGYMAMSKVNGHSIDSIIKNLNDGVWIYIHTLDSMQTSKEVEYEVF
jgi:hypothetical protein